MTIWANQFHGKKILPGLQWHYGTVTWRHRVARRLNCCSEMFRLDYWWIASQCNTHGYVWKYILFSYMKGFGQVRFCFDDIWQRVNFDAQCVSEQTGKLSGGSRVYDPWFRQICPASTSTVHWKICYWLVCRPVWEWILIFNLWHFIYKEWCKMQIYFANTFLCLFRKFQSGSGKNKAMNNLLSQ